MEHLKHDMLTRISKSQVQEDASGRRTKTCTRWLATVTSGAQQTIREWLVCSSSPLLESAIDGLAHRQTQVGIAGELIESWLPKGNLLTQPMIPPKNTEVTNRPNSASDAEQGLRECRRRRFRDPVHTPGTPFLRHFAGVGPERVPVADRRRDPGTLWGCNYRRPTGSLRCSQSLLLETPYVSNEDGTIKQGVNQSG